MATKVEGFSEGFGKYVCAGESITVQIGKLTATATLYLDEISDAPDQMQDGFWPSSDPNAAGYVLPEDFEKESARAKKVMSAWLKDEWAYFGVVVTIEKAGVQIIGKYEHALWGIEGNYPDSDNSYLLEVANELLPEALEAARAKLKALCA